METSSLSDGMSMVKTATEQSSSPSLELKEDDHPRQSTSTDGSMVEEEYVIPYDPDEHGFRRIIRNFAPSWFVVTMGTGGVSTLLYQIPYPSRWLHILSAIFLVLNAVLWVLFMALSCIRYAMYPELWGAMLRNPRARLFLGAIPTGFSTILNVMVPLCTPLWGQNVVIVAWFLWWINGVVAIFLCLYLTLIVINAHKVDLSGMTPMWLLPILPAVISSTTGGIIAPLLLDSQHQLWTLLISYTLWGLAVPTAVFVMVLYFYRLQVHEMLDREVIVSVFLPIGVFGLGGFSICLFGHDAITIFPKTETLTAVPDAGAILFVFGFIVSLLMWGAGLFWVFLAIAMIYQCRTFPFNMGWWSFTFPVAVYTLSAIQLGKELNSEFFKVLGTILSCIVFILWIMVAILTIRDSISGKMFFAPCLTTDMKLQEMKIKRLVKRTTGGNAS